MSVINCSGARLPRELDVQVNASIPRTEKVTDMTLAAVLVQTGNLPIGAGRIQIYNDSDAVQEVWTSTSEAYKAARDFFAVPTGPTEFAIAQIFSTPQSGFLTTGATGDIAAFTAVTDGSFTVSVDAVSVDVSGLDFSGAADLAACAVIIQAGLTAAGAATSVIHDGASFVITSDSTGDSSTVSVLTTTAPAAGTDISGEQYMNGRDGEAITQQGYTPGTIADEALLVQKAAGCKGKFVYGWLLEESLRDSDDAVTFAQWIEAQDKAIFSPCSNDPLALNPNSQIDISPVLQALSLTRTCGPQYHDKKDFYPDAALLAVMLGVDYSGENTAITAKFKDFPGIPTVGVDVNEWATLEAKGYNILSATGNNSRVNREGTTESDDYFIDDRVNLDNLVEEAQVAVYNVFLRNPKVPYTVPGQGLLEAGLAVVLNRYVRNGVLADRAISDPVAENGIEIKPAFKVESGAIQLATAADRAIRKAPPIAVIVYLAGAIHSVKININAYT